MLLSKCWKNGCGDRMLLVGDSHAWRLDGQVRPALAALGVANHDIINAGIGGDESLDVLWRVKEMCLSSAYPVGIVHVGINDILNSIDYPSFAGYSPTAIAGNIISCALQLRDGNPTMVIGVMGIIPTKDANGELNDLVKHVNLHLKETC